MNYCVTLKYIINGLRNDILRTINGAVLRPTLLWLEVTDRCNSRCIHCNIWRKRPTPNPLTPKEIRGFLSNPLFRDVKYIINSGGEPTLRGCLKEILMCEHEVLPKARLQLSTNGLLPERVIELTEFSLNNNIPLDIGISLDGVGEKHDLIRGVKGNFDKVDYLLSKLVKLRDEYEDKIGILVGFTLSDLTASSFKEVKLYTEKKGVPLLVQCYGEGPFYGNIGKGLSANKRALSNIIQSLPASPIRNMWLNSLRGKSIRFRCYALHTFCVLHCNGDLSPCLGLFNINVGNLRKSPPTELWWSSKARRTRNTIKKCKGCLNDWGVNWSMGSSFLYYTRKRLIEKLMRRTIE